MKPLATAAFAACVLCTPLHAQTRADSVRWDRFAARVTIIRDDWGIAHVYGHTDAEAVFGMIYAQAEDDFNRVETNYLNALGRLAEAEGASAIWSDLRMKLFIDPDTLRAQYRASPLWLRRLMDAWADGLNFYLARHPDVHPRVLTHFEPWMALSFSEGSIGGDIERVNLGSLAFFYGGDGPAPSGASGGGEGLPAPPDPPAADPMREPGGSNGIAIGPANTASHHAMLLINPHTSFFFRSELQMVSDEGLNAYGAVTWGQFFVYQGFNDRAGWMHTSSGVDAIDEYLETVAHQGARWVYRYGGRTLPMTVRTITVPYRTATGMAERRFTVFYTRHGPVVRRLGERWVSVSLMNEPARALTQSYQRTKAHSYAEFRRIMDLHTNSSNNTIYADADGNIAYFHANFIPRRDTSFDWTRPVDGSNPATAWGPLLGVDESPHLLNPPTGWLYNSNDAPWWAAGAWSPRRADYPAYVETGGSSARGRHAVRVLQHIRAFTLDSLIDAAFDSYLTWFESGIPALVRAWDSLPEANPLKARLHDQIAVLRDWDLRWSVSSVPTTLAVFWGTNITRMAARPARAAGVSVEQWVGSGMTETELLTALASASDTLTSQFGTWRTPWGEVNRFQRLTSDIVQQFDDSAPSSPVGFTSAIWGSLASFGARPYPGTHRWYGTSGNSFVAVVEFGDSVRARAVTAGGESGDPESPHFKDEVERYATGDLRPVYFYRDQLRGHTEREYHPGG